MFYFEEKMSSMTAVWVADMDVIYIFDWHYNFSIFYFKKLEVMIYLGWIKFSKSFILLSVSIYNLIPFSTGSKEYSCLTEMKVILHQIWFTNTLPGDFINFISKQYNLILTIIQYVEITCEDDYK